MNNTNKMIGIERVHPRVASEMKDAFNDEQDVGDEDGWDDEEKEDSDDGDEEDDDDNDGDESEDENEEEDDEPIVFVRDVPLLRLENVTQQTRQFITKDGRVIDVENHKKPERKGLLFGGWFRRNNSNVQAPSTSLPPPQTVAMSHTIKNSGDEISVGESTPDDDADEDEEEADDEDKLSDVGDGDGDKEGTFHQDHERADLHEEGERCTHERRKQDFVDVERKGANFNEGDSFNICKKVVNEEALLPTKDVEKQEGCGFDMDIQLHEAELQAYQEVGKLQSSLDSGIIGSAGFQVEDIEAKAVNDLLCLPEKGDKLCYGYHIGARQHQHEDKPTLKIDDHVNIVSQPVDQFVDQFDVRHGHPQSNMSNVEQDCCHFNTDIQLQEAELRACNDRQAYHEDGLPQRSCDSGNASAGFGEAVTEAKEFDDPPRLPEKGENLFYSDNHDVQKCPHEDEPSLKCVDQVDTFLHPQTCEVQQRHPQGDKNLLYNCLNDAQEEHERCAGENGVCEKLEVLLCVKKEDSSLNGCEFDAQHVQSQEEATLEQITYVSDNSQHGLHFHDPPSQLRNGDNLLRGYQDDTQRAEEFVSENLQPFEESLPKVDNNLLYDVQPFQCKEEPALEPGSHVCEFALPRQARGDVLLSNGDDGNYSSTLGSAVCDDLNFSTAASTSKQFPDQSGPAKLLEINQALIPLALTKKKDARKKLASTRKKKGKKSFVELDVSPQSPSPKKASLDRFLSPSADSPSLNALFKKTKQKQFTTYGDEISVGTFGTIKTIKSYKPVRRAEKEKALIEAHVDSIFDDTAQERRPWQSKKSLKSNSALKALPMRDSIEEEEMSQADDAVEDEAKHEIKYVGGGIPGNITESNSGDLTPPSYLEPLLDEMVDDDGSFEQEIKIVLDAENDVNMDSDLNATIADQPDFEVAWKEVLEDTARIGDENNQKQTDVPESAQMTEEEAIKTPLSLAIFQASISSIPGGSPSKGPEKKGKQPNLQASSKKSRRPKVRVGEKDYVSFFTSKLNKAKTSECRKLKPPNENETGIMVKSFSNLDLTKAILKDDDLLDRKSRSDHKATLSKSKKITDKPNGNEKRRFPSRAISKSRAIASESGSVESKSSSKGSKKSNSDSITALDLLRKAGFSTETKQTDAATEYALELKKRGKKLTTVAGLKQEMQDIRKGGLSSGKPPKPGKKAGRAAHTGNIVRQKSFKAPEQQSIFEFQPAELTRRNSFSDVNFFGVQAMSNDSARSHSEANDCLFQSFDWNDNNQSPTDASFQGQKKGASKREKKKKKPSLGVPNPLSSLFFGDFVGKES